MSAADELDAVLLQRAVGVQRHGGVERGLAAQGGQHRVGALLGDDLVQDLGGDRLDVGGVGELRVGHDRRGVGVDQGDPDALGPQHPAGLGAGVVELAALADHDRPGADDQDGLQVVRARHGYPRLRRLRWGVGKGPALMRRVHERGELVEQVHRVVRAGGRLGVVLHGEGGAVQQPQALDHAVVEVDVGDRGRAERGVKRIARARGDVHPARRGAVAGGSAAAAAAVAPTVTLAAAWAAMTPASGGSAAAKPWLWLVM